MCYGPLLFIHPCITAVLVLAGLSSRYLIETPKIREGLECLTATCTNTVRI